MRNPHYELMKAMDKFWNDYKNNPDLNLLNDDLSHCKEWDELVGLDGKKEYLSQHKGYLTKI